MGTGELLKLAGDYDLFSKAGHAQSTRIPIKTKLTVQDMETFRMISLRDKGLCPGYSENSGMKDCKRTCHHKMPRAKNSPERSTKETF